MSHSINLSSARKNISPIYLRILYGSIGLFCIVFIISFSLVIYRLVLKSTYDELEKKEQLLNEQLLSMQDKKNKILETKQRLSDIKNITSNRAPITYRINKLLSLLNSSEEIDSVNGSSDEITLSVASSDLLSASEILEQKLISLASDKKEGIRRIELRSFGLNPKTRLYDLSFLTSYK